MVRQVAVAPLDVLVWLLRRAVEVLSLVEVLVWSLRRALELLLRALEVLAPPGSSPAEETRPQQPTQLPPARPPRVAPTSVPAPRLRDGISWAERTAAAACAGKAAGLRLGGIAAPATPLATDLRCRLHLVAREASGVVHRPCLRTTGQADLLLWIERPSGAVRVFPLERPPVFASFPSKKEADAWEAALWDSAVSQQ